jgi:putative FmdB family regulatory protein
MATAIPKTYRRTRRTASEIGRDRAITAMRNEAFGLHEGLDRSLQQPYPPEQEIHRHSLKRAKFLARRAIMPTYEYVCSACGNGWEAEQRITEEPLDTCPKCGRKTAKRQISAGGTFILKGGGWYSDLYSSKKSSSSESKPDPNSAKSNEKTTTAPASSEAPSKGSSEAPSKGSSEAPSKGSEAPSKGSEAPSKGSKSVKAA